MSSHYLISDGACPFPGLDSRTRAMRCQLLQGPNVIVGARFGVWVWGWGQCAAVGHGSVSECVCV